ncbi:hypothetical protein BGZ89_002758 [Linnemannia elongata]|nr:hypothetical protein BGZ89_002758 [Linnemannia elongata]
MIESKPTGAEIAQRLHAWTTTTPDFDKPMNDQKETNWMNEDILRRELEYYKNILSGITSLRDLDFASHSGGDGASGRVVTLSGGLNVAFTLDILDVLDGQAKEIESLRGDKARLNSRLAELEGEKCCWEMGMFDGARVLGGGSSSCSKKTTETATEGLKLFDSIVLGQEKSMSHPPSNAQDVEVQSTTTTTPTKSGEQAVAAISGTMDRVEKEILAQQSQTTEVLFNSVFLVKDTPYKQELQEAQDHVQVAYRLRERVVLDVLKSNIGRTELQGGIRALQEQVGGLRMKRDAFLWMLETLHGTWAQAMEVRVRYLTAIHILEATIRVLDRYRQEEQQHQQQQPQQQQQQQQRKTRY